jgi:enhancing lycopene biosynthesis protein 2
MPKSPRKIGVIISGGAFWEIIYSFLHIENKGYLRLPITVQVDGNEQSRHNETLLSRLPLEPIENVRATGIDALIVPGGADLYRTLCDFEKVGDAFKVNDVFKTLVKGIFRLGKPIGVFGPASLPVVKALQGIANTGMVVTVGNDPRLQGGVGSAGGQAVVTRPGEVVLDEDNMIVSTGGELATRRPTEVFEACENLIKGLDEFIKGRKHEKY